MLSILCFRLLRGGRGRRLLLLGLVTIEVLGACGTVQVLRRAHPTRPVAVRYRIKRSHLLWVLTLGRDTLGAELRYRGQVLTPPAECGPAGEATRPEVLNAWRLAGPDTRWLLKVRCGRERTAYVLRLAAGSPEFLRVGSITNLPYHLRPQLRPLGEGAASFLPETDTTGWLVDWAAGRSEAVALPALRPVLWYPWADNVAYTTSPNRRVLARVHRPAATDGRNNAWPLAPGRQLIIDQYDLDRRSARRLTVEGSYPPRTPLLSLTYWTETNGRWELLPRP
ncbi:hypothetical protein EJV47_08770 [Hymenobacter gummosus]|uniref:Uncharacterized protein n=1 Tax=Hymenobacter gummosus TaxID=1776032 RepID=A0A3S0HA83_9BACT|nr:hypothetical protein [Hymenobacter gummosus]RTQ50714.1 hypothetical protein EJV47_08770 [Hymenobacter gummosus]